MSSCHTHEAEPTGNWSVTTGMSKNAIRTPLISACALVTALVAVVTAGRWRLAPVEWPDLWPGPGVGPLPGAWFVALLTVAVVLVVGAGLVVGRAGRRAWVVTLLWPAAPLALAWALVPLAGPPSVTLLVVTGLTLLAATILICRRPVAAPGGHRSWHEGNWWRAAHVAVVIAGVAVGAVLGGFGDLAAVGLSLLLYPAYAAIQLTLVLVVTWPWLAVASGGSRPAMVATCAGLFALVHWPNPLVMLLTGMGMVFWAGEYGRGRPLWALAVSMGLLATIAAQGLPDELTGHMRVGPGQVRTLAVERLARETLAAVRPGDASAPVVVPMIATLYPGAVGREATPGELSRWQRAIAFERRAFLAWVFLASDEARRKREAAPPPLDGSIYWTDLPPPWPRAIRDQAARGTADLPWPAYVASCYEHVLGRRASAAELAAWPTDLGPNQYARLVRAVLERRHELATAAFDTLTSESLEFWR